MLAVDTNVVVRYLTRDDPAQFALAVATMEDGAAFVGLTVLLETEWVLRSIYGYRPTRVVAALRGLAGLRTVTLEDESLVGVALQWVEEGLDFADALHLARAQSCEAFITFDRDLATHAAELSAVPVRHP
jgi:predicted nucleic-acid-binding protein